MGTAKKLFSVFGGAIVADMREQGRINADMKVVEESLEICRTSTNPETRISRMGVAIGRLAHMCKEYPCQPNVSAWSKQGLDLAESYPAFIVANLSELIKGNIEKIERLKTQTARHSKAEKLIEKLTPYLALTTCDTEWLASQIFLLKKACPPGRPNANTGSRDSNAVACFPTRRDSCLWRCQQSHSRSACKAHFMARQVRHLVSLGHVV